MVATEVVALVHVPPVVASAKVVVEPTVSLVVPVMAATDGTVMTETAAVLDELPQLLVTV